MEHLWHDLAAALLIAFAYVATREARRRWRSRRSISGGDFRANRFMKWRDGALLQASILVLLAIALELLRPFDWWVFIASLAIGAVANSMIEARLQHQS
jgi:hypothetical protein